MPHHANRAPVAGFIFENPGAGADVTADVPSSAQAFLRLDGGLVLGAEAIPNGPVTGDVLLQHNRQVMSRTQDGTDFIGLVYATRLPDVGPYFDNVVVVGHPGVDGVYTSHAILFSDPGPYSLYTAGAGFTDSGTYLGVNAWHKHANGAGSKWIHGTRGTSGGGQDLLQVGNGDERVLLGSFTALGGSAAGDTIVGRALVFAHASAAVELPSNAAVYLDGSARTRSLSYNTVNARFQFAGAGLHAAGDLTTDANLRWLSGTAFAATFDHANTATRTYTLPDAAGTVALLGLAQTWTADQTLGDAFGLKWSDAQIRRTGGGILGVRNVGNTSDQQFQAGWLRASSGFIAHNTTSPLFQARDSADVLVSVAQLVQGASPGVAHFDLIRARLAGQLELAGFSLVADTVVGTQVATAANQKLGFFGKTPVVQRAATGLLTDNTGGGVDGTLGDVNDGFGKADATATNNNFADLASKVNHLRNVLTDLGLMAA